VGSVEQMTDRTDSGTISWVDVVGDSKAQKIAFLDFRNNNHYLLATVLSLKEPHAFIIVRLPSEAYSFRTQGPKFSHCRGVDRKEDALPLDGCLAEFTLLHKGK
jgi:hypothetical protein